MTYTAHRRSPWAWACGCIAGHSTASISFSVSCAGSGSGLGEPECNGIMERWIRTLKEECLYLHDFQTLDEARQLIERITERYNREGLLEPHRNRTSAEVP